MNAAGGKGQASTIDDEWQQWPHVLTVIPGVVLSAVRINAMSLGLCYPMIWAIAVATRFVRKRRLALSIGAAIGPFLTGVLYDRNGNYDLALQVLTSGFPASGCRAFPTHAATSEIAKPVWAT